VLEDRLADALGDAAMRLASDRKVTLLMRKK